MAYIGRGLDRGNYLKLDDISSQFDGSETTFNLTTGGKPFFPGSAFALLVSISGVIQEPEEAYQVNSSQILFTGPPLVVDTFFAIAMSQPINLNTVSDGTITTNKLVNNAVTEEKLAASAKGVGIQSAGSAIGFGITQLNFIGAGNTFAINGTSVDISIAGGGGGSVGGITTAAGIGTEVLVGIGTTVPVGSAHSEGSLQVQGNIAAHQGLYLTDEVIVTDVFIPSGKNGIIVSPTVAIGNTIDVAPGSTLVVL